MKVHTVILSSLFSAVFCAQGDEGFMRYQFILDKDPFSQESSGDSAVEIPASQSFARNMRLSMITQGVDGRFWAGIIDQDSGKNYILTLQDPQDGLELISADAGSSAVMVRKGSEVVILKLEPGSARSIFRNPAQIVQETRIRELSKPVQVQAVESSASGLAFQKYLESVQADITR